MYIQYFTSNSKNKYVVLWSKIKRFKKKIKHTFLALVYTFLDDKVEK